MNKKYYILALVVFLIAVAARVVYLEIQNKKETISIENVKEKQGTPVDVCTARRGDLTILTVISGKYRDGIIMADITPEKAALIKKGTIFSSAQGITGYVEKVSSKPSRFSGLNSCTLKVERGNSGEGEIVRVMAETGRIKDAVIISKECVVDGTHVWVFNNGKLEKREVKIKGAGSDHAAVSSGLKEGELVVITYGEKFTQGERAVIHTRKGR